MASMRKYEAVEALFASAPPAVDEALEAQRLASRAARRAELEAAHAVERAEQAELRALLLFSERLGVGSGLQQEVA